MDTSRVCKGHSAREAGGAGLSGAWQVSQRTAVTFCEAGWGDAQIRLPVPLMPVAQRGESRVVRATRLIPAACHSPVDTRLVSGPVTTRCRLRPQSPAHPCSPVGDTHLRGAPRRSPGLRRGPPPVWTAPDARPGRRAPRRRPSGAACCVKAGAPLQRSRSQGKL